MVSESASRRTDVRQRTTLGNWFRLMIRVLGLAGVLAFIGGVGMLIPELGYPQPESLRTLWPQAKGLVESSLAEEQGKYARLFTIIALAGGATVLAWLLLELLGGLFLVAGRKTVVGTNAVLQIVLAVALLVIVNVYSFTHYARYDLTRDAAFTLPPKQVEQLQKLRTDSPTTVVVLQLHKTAGTLSDRPDAYDYAAERVVVEKVYDLVDQLREFGPQFNVVVLDVADDRYDQLLRRLTRTRPGLAEAIREAMENSIFFYADGKVRTLPATDAEKYNAKSVPNPAEPGTRLVYPAAITRMSFAEFYQLDKTSSREATKAERENIAAAVGGLAFAPDVRGQGNLVLIPRGRDVFVRKVLALEDRKPKVALAVIHPVLSTKEDVDIYGAAGLRKALEENGFEVTDIILKRWNERSELPPATALTYEENELDRAETRSAMLEQFIKRQQSEIDQTDDDLQQARKALEGYSAKSADEKEKALDTARQRLSPYVIGTIRTVELARDVIQGIEEYQEQNRAALKLLIESRAESDRVLTQLRANESVVENRRTSDVQAKFSRYLSDCDILIIPRITVVNLSQRLVIAPALHSLVEEQAEVVREFIGAGKPVLFAFGPTNMNGERYQIRGLSPDDAVEQLLPRLGIELGKQTLVTSADVEAMADGNSEGLSSVVDIPALVFDPAAKNDTDDLIPNPIAEAYRVTTRTVDRELPIQRSSFRPVYLAPGFEQKVPFAAEIMFTSPDVWNESKPLLDIDQLRGELYIPKYDPPRPGDPTKGTRDEERKGPFPVGVAIELPAPTASELKIVSALPGLAGGLSTFGLALEGMLQDRPKVRIVSYGHGGLFTGEKLTPGQETLLLHTLNWQLRRDERLPSTPSDDEKWRYPRVELTSRETAAWRLGTLLGLPIACAVFGLIVLMVRRVR